MPLPILSTPASQPSDQDLVRFYHRTEFHWTEHLAEPTPLEVGTAFANKQLPEVFDANCMLEVSLPAGMPPATAVEEVTNHFASQGTSCLAWVMNPSTDPELNRPLIDHLLSAGHRPMTADIMHLGQAAAWRDVPDIRIIPARASYRHARQLAEESARQWSTPALADASLQHLDDAHWDAILALDGTTAAGTAGVLAAGETGRIDEVFVSEPYRRRGIGQMLMSRVLEICARSLFKHVLLGVLPDNAAAIALYRKMGFRKIGTITSYRAPKT